MITEYEQIYADAIEKTKKVLYGILDQISGKDDVDVDLADTNYDFLVWTLERQIADFEKLKVRYRFEKMDREEFDVILKNIAEGKPIDVITVSKEHRVRSVDTLQLLSDVYGISVEKILKYNQINPSDFEERSLINATIQVPVIVNIKERNQYAELPVFGSLNGRKAWGTDWPNSLQIKNGDIEVLDNEKTLAQGILNRFGQYGDIPGHEEYLIDTGWGGDYPAELKSSLDVVKLSEKVLLDKRIKKVDDVQIEEFSTGLIIRIYSTPINGTKPLEVIIKDKLADLGKELK